MFDLLVDHLWQSTLIVPVAAAMAFALRRRPARWRYRIWLAASLKFLVPFSLLVVLGSEWSSRTTSAATSQAAWHDIAVRWIQPMAERAARGSSTSSSAASDTPSAPPTLLRPNLAQPDTMSNGISEVRGVDQSRSNVATGSLPDASPAESHPATERFSAAAFLLALWISGSLIVVVRRVTGWLRLQAVLRGAKPVDVESARRLGLDLRETDSAVEPGVFGILRPVLLVPKGLIELLPPAQLAAVLRHEQMHIRRRDNLSALVHMLVEALFWFHPFVWWIGARMLTERESACDEAVLAAGTSPLDYAAVILRVCELRGPSSLTCAAGVSGGSLESRVAHITANAPVQSLGRLRATMLAIVPGALLVIPVAAGLLKVPDADAQVADEPGRSPDYSNWYPLEGPPPLVTGFGGMIDSQSATWREFRFNMSLFQCQALPNDASDAVGTDDLPGIRDFRDLVAFAYDINGDLIDWPERLGTTGLRVGTGFLDEQRYRIEECRRLVRETLESGYALRTHRDGERYVVDNLAEPEVPLPLGAPGRPRLAIAEETLNGYAGYYYGIPDRPFNFAPVHRVRRDGENLILDWNGASYLLYPSSPTQFSTNLPFGSTPSWMEGGNVSLAFRNDAETGRLAITRGSPASVPEMRALSIDAAIAETWLADIERRSRELSPMPGAGELVAEIAARLESGASDATNDESVAARAAAAVIAGLEEVRSGALDGRGELISVSLNRVDRAGRDAFEIRFERLTVEVVVVPAGPETIAQLFLDARCPLNDRIDPERQSPCIVPVQIDIDPTLTDLSRPPGSLLGTRLLSSNGGFVSPADGVTESRHRLQLSGCHPADAMAVDADPEQFGPAPVLASIRDIVLYAYDLEPYELTWPAEIGMPLLQQGIGYNGYFNDEQCGAYLRRALAAELEFTAHFEPVTVPGWQLRATPGFSLEVPNRERIGRIDGGAGRLQGFSAGMDDLVSHLRGRLEMPVADQTGLTGVYDFFIRWDPPRRDAGETDADGIERMRESLLEVGLLLEPFDTTVERLVVDSIEAPPVPEPPAVGWDR